MTEVAEPSAKNTAADLVREARTRHGLSQRALADKAGVPRSTVAAVESGTRQPSVRMLERLLEAAGFRLEASLTNTVRPSELLERYRAEVAEVLARNPVSQAWVSGSVARGDDRPDSDLDLLVEMKPEGSFVDSVSLGEELSALLSCPVDVATTKELESNAPFRRRVSRDRRSITMTA